MRLSRLLPALSVVTSLWIGCSSSDSSPRETSAATSTSTGNAVSSASSSATGAAGAATSGAGGAATSGAGGAGTAGGSAGASTTASGSGSAGSSAGTTGSGTGGGGSSGLDASVTPEAGGGGESDAADCIPGTGTTDIDANTARDNKTCLVWQKAPTCMGAWKTVAQCCADLAQSGFSDWRMPTVSELFTWAKASTNAEYMTCPAYVKPGAGDPDNNFEYCTVTTYSAVTCAHRGQATTSGTFCVRGHGQNVPPVTTETTCSAPCGLASELVYQACSP